MTNKPTPDDDWLENTLKELWLEFYNNSTLTGMSDTYYIAQEEAKAAINAKITELLNKHVHYCQDCGVVNTTSTDTEGVEV